MGGGGGSSQTTSSGQSQSHGVSDQHGEFHFPQWYEDAAKGNYEAGKAIVDRPYAAYEGTVVPAFSDVTNNTMAQIEADAYKYQPAYDQAGQYIQDLMKRGDVRRGRVEDYMNPYVNDVERRAIDNASIKGKQDQRAIELDAMTKRAFGGSRQAIQQGVQGAETARGIGDLSAKLRADAYDKGVAAQQADWGRQFNNVAAQQGLAKTEADLAKAAQAGESADYFNLLSAGKMQEDKQRETLEETYKKFLEKRDWDKNQLTWLAGLLGITPVGHTEDIHKVEDVTATEQGVSNTKSKNSMNIGSMLSGGGSLIGALAGLSDRDTKTNIEKLGTDPSTKLPVYAYDYKADVKGKATAGPKRVGFMAQDVEKKYPKAVHKVSGKRVIDFTQIPLG